jgi:hypothetical protein
VIAFRPEASLLYVNADSVLESVSERLEAEAARDIGLGRGFKVCKGELPATAERKLSGVRILSGGDRTAWVCTGAKPPSDEPSGMGGFAEWSSDYRPR